MHDILDNIIGMSSGECRWVGREDIHVYCRAPLVRTITPCGKTGWEPGPATFCVVCPEAGLRHGNWTTAAECVAVIRSILQSEVAA